MAFLLSQTNLYELLLIASLAFCGAVVFIQFMSIIRLRDKIAKAEYQQYIDTSGIGTNPPLFIDTWQGKTINFRVDDKHIIHIPHMRPQQCFGHLKAIAAYYKILTAQAEKVAANKKEERQDKIINAYAYYRIIVLIYNLSKDFVKNKRRYFKALHARGKNDVAFILDVTEQVIDYWTYIKKKLSLLATASSLRISTNGGRSSWDSVKLASDGKISIRPRYESFWNAQRN